MTHPQDSAFPVIVPNTSLDFWTSDGLTKRELFAALAMQSLLSTVRWQNTTTSNRDAAQSVLSDFAMLAVDIADRLIMQLSADEQKSTPGKECSNSEKNS